MKQVYIPLAALLWGLVLTSCGVDSLPNRTDGSGFKNGAVVTAHPLATQVGLEVLQNGGNAFDAAVAVNMALAVVYPRAGNIGGGGFMVYRSADGKTGALDFRERAPLAASRDMYLDTAGNVIKNLSREGVLSVGIPGSVAGMVALHNRFGSKPWHSLFEKPLFYAEMGFAITQNQADVLNRYPEVFSTYNGRDVFVNRAGGWKAGDTLRQVDLAATLARIAKEKNGGFYSGKTADDLVRTMQKFNGLITHRDLELYEAVWRKPIETQFMGMTIISMPPPSSGGVAISQLLYGFALLHGDTLKRNSAKYIHLLTELERRVYADRATFLGDMDYYKVPLQMLLDSSYLRSRFDGISMTTATPSSEIKSGEVEVVESFETTHFIVADRWGNIVSVTTTLNGYFGSKVIAEGSGFFLNNEMDDFSAKPGVPNQFGLVGSAANSIQPQKRMLSSMTPTIVLKNDSFLAAVGTPGGATIITTVMQTLLNALVYNMEAQQAVDVTKFHAQWLPDVIHYEEGKVDSFLLDSLQVMGHKLKAVSQLGKMKFVRYKQGVYRVAGDTSRGDDSAAGY